MGLFKKLRAVFSTEGAIMTSAYVYQEKYPHLSFLESLERSLVETRPGWTQELWDLVAPTITLRENAPGDENEREHLMVRQVAHVEQKLREGKDPRELF